uniref:Uncharacterized protein n=1 Tax=Candidatus Kentrum sp. LFY TaxID=2126342 RepID=A0A450UP58_9GAMM|nr:MAG: hypothetical protein BECKLFY1418A_GA0070994_10391 [Candidatus Kentron sp. LFY]
MCLWIRLAVTFSFGVMAYSGRDFHPADESPSRAHWSRLCRVGVDWTAIPTGMDFHLDRRFLRVLDPADFPVHKRFEFLDPIEDSLDLHLRSFSDRWVVGTSIISKGCGVRFPNSIFEYRKLSIVIGPVDPVSERHESVVSGQQGCCPRAVHTSRRTKARP